MFTISHLLAYSMMHALHLVLLSFLLTSGLAEQSNQSAEKRAPRLRVNNTPTPKNIRSEPRLEVDPQDISPNSVNPDCEPPTALKLETKAESTKEEGESTKTSATTDANLIGPDNKVGPGAKVTKKEGESTKATVPTDAIKVAPGNKVGPEAKVTMEEGESTKATVRTDAMKVRPGNKVGPGSMADAEVSSGERVNLLSFSSAVRATKSSSSKDVLGSRDIKSSSELTIRSKKVNLRNAV